MQWVSSTLRGSSVDKSKCFWILYGYVAPTLLLFASSVDQIIQCQWGECRNNPHKAPPTTLSATSLVAKKLMCQSWLRWTGVTVIANDSLKFCSRRQANHVHASQLFLCILILTSYDCNFTQKVRATVLFCHLFVFAEGFVALFMVSMSEFPMVQVHIFVPYCGSPSKDAILHLVDVFVVDCFWPSRAGFVFLLINLLTLASSSALTSPSAILIYVS